MTVFMHELRRNRLSLIIWSAAIAFMLGVSVIIYPEMSSQMNEMGDMFSNMGAFSDAFGMDQLNFGEFMGYFGIECGNTLGLGGAFFAAIIGVSALCKEEKDKTAEFLLTHPISRARIITEKLLSVICQLLILNLSVAAVTAIVTVAISAEANAAKMALLFLANFILQVEVASVCFGISALLRGNGIGIAIGIAVGAYFLNILANLTDKAEFLKYITPYGFTDGGYIVSNGKLEIKYILVGLAFTAVGIALAYIRYTKKDIS